jgi:hypothetical protein
MTRIDTLRSAMMTLALGAQASTAAVAAPDDGLW